MLLLLLLVFVLAAAGCAHSPPATGTGTARAKEEATYERAEFERKVAQRMDEEEGIFDILSRKMDEYQNLLDACDRISQSGEDSEIKASCASRLKTMKQELGHLSDLLRDGQ